MMKNKDVHKAFEKSGIKKWEVADFLGIADTTFSRKLRYELSPEKKEKIFKAIEELEREKEVK